MEGSVGVGNDEALAHAGEAVPDPDVAVETAPDPAAAPPPAKPDVTKAQLIGLVPVVAKLGTAFGLFTLSGDQQEALTLAIGGGAALFIADAVIRFGRSRHLGRR